MQYVLPENKKLKDVSLEEAVSLHLFSGSSGHDLVDFRIQSLLEDAIDAMCQSRSIQSVSSYAPLFCGFAILDQLGGCYYNKSKNPQVSDTSKSGIIKALHYFGQYNESSPESNAFYALRNFLVHDAAIRGKTRQGKWYAFRYNWETQNAITLPAEMWNGSASDISSDKTVVINPRKFTDEILCIKDKIKSIACDRPNDLGVNIGKEDILHKYLVWTNK